METDRKYLGPAEILVLGPDVFDLDRPAGYLQRGQLGGRKKLFNAVAEAAKTGAPRDRQAAVYRTLGNRLGAKEFFEIGREAVAVGLRHQRGFHVAVDLNGALGEELFQVGEKTVGDDVL